MFFDLQTFSLHSWKLLFHLNYDSGFDSRIFVARSRCVYLNPTHLSFSFNLAFTFLPVPVTYLYLDGKARYF